MTDEETRSLVHDIRATTGTTGMEYPKYWDKVLKLCDIVETGDKCQAQEKEIQEFTGDPNGTVQMAGPDGSRTTKSGIRIKGLEESRTTEVNHPPDSPEQSLKIRIVLDCQVDGELPLKEKGELIRRWLQEKILERVAVISSEEFDKSPDWAILVNSCEVDLDTTAIDWYPPAGKKMASADGCVACGGPSRGGKYKVVDKESGGFMEVPCCDECYRRGRLRTWLDKNNLE